MSAAIDNLKSAVEMAKKAAVTQKKAFEAIDKNLDLLPAKERERIKKQVSALKEALKNGDAAGINKVINQLEG